jgi:hypothetical protein
MKGSIKPFRVIVPRMLVVHTMFLLNTKGKQFITRATKEKVATIDEVREK